MPPGRPEVEVLPAAETRFEEKMVTDSYVYAYVRSAIVTDYVKAAGSGVYRVGRVPAFFDVNDYSSRQFAYSGWTLAVVYRYLDEGQPFRSITYYAGGFPVIATLPPVVTTLRNFVTPNNDNISARFLVSSGEGDHNLTGDQAFFGTEGNVNLNVPLAVPNNVKSNFFASQINDANGNPSPSGTFGTVNHKLVWGF